MADNKYHYALGRRKTATATVRLYEGKGENTINGKPVATVYPVVASQSQIVRPFHVAGLDEGQYYFTAKVKGSGPSSQLQAIQHGLARAISLMDGDLKQALKREGLITRDPRMVERKKPGQRKARKSEQYSKR